MVQTPCHGAPGEMGNMKAGLGTAAGMEVGWQVRMKGYCEILGVTEALRCLSVDWSVPSR